MEAVVFAAQRFGFYTPFFEVLTDGLIHKTYKVTSANRSIILQQVNTHVFQDIDAVINNYKLIYNHVRSGKPAIPAMLKTTDGKDIWIDQENSCWRAFEFIPNTYTESLPASPEKIFSAATCYGEFTVALSGLDSHQLKPTIPGFHDVSNRYHQFMDATLTASPERLIASDPLLRKLGERKHLVHFYNDLKTNPEFKLRPMHHDAKLSNILFDKTTQLAVCPIDLDTTMAGYFFSDAGDMIRSMISDKDENATSCAIHINADVYQAIISGYESGMGNSLTKQEKKTIHHAGLLMVYMQALRFLTDFLTNDIYYKIDYPLQNLDRALNQVTLLEKLESFLRTKYNYEIK